MQRLAGCRPISKFQLTAARRRLGYWKKKVVQARLFQLTAARRRLDFVQCGGIVVFVCFNSQPPEGGWSAKIFSFSALLSFQLTAARRRLVGRLNGLVFIRVVSTHSRPKAAGASSYCQPSDSNVSTHSRPKAAGIIDGIELDLIGVSTHSRPKAAGHTDIFHKRT